MPGDLEPNLGLVGTADDDLFSIPVDLLGEHLVSFSFEALLLFLLGLCLTARV